MRRFPDRFESSSTATLLAVLLLLHSPAQATPGEIHEIFVPATHISSGAGLEIVAKCRFSNENLGKIVGRDSMDPTSIASLKQGTHLIATVEQVYRSSVPHLVSGKRFQNNEFRVVDVEVNSYVPIVIDRRLLTPGTIRISLVLIVDGKVLSRSKNLVEVTIGSRATTTPSSP